MTAVHRITSRQLAIMVEIIRYTDEMGYPPRVDYLALHQGVVKSTIHWDLIELRDQGYVEFITYHSRTLKVIVDTEISARADNSGDKPS